MPRDRRSSRTKLLAGDGPLTRVPPVAAFLVVTALFVVAVVVRGALGAVLLGMLALGVGGLLAATWGVLAPAQRAARVLILAVLVAVTVSMFLTA
ncbi:MAG TPA: DUF6703 family protein [Actinophytocola sp.]|uniref:DUF6703 family protein n=1 Tax=Actinophytocola sp. TaxID=1872138 RepID=UPI002DB9E491|nr:DUF6703 family protein [Actinophytocola sp.]HEU5474397.1 DUF6703 family protein [Actinophytocola sp.]